MEFQLRKIREFSLQMQQFAKICFLRDRNYTIAEESDLLLDWKVEAIPIGKFNIPEKRVGLVLQIFIN